MTQGRACHAHSAPWPRGRTACSSSPPTRASPVTHHNREVCHAAAAGDAPGRRHVRQACCNAHTQHGSMLVDYHSMSPRRLCGVPVHLSPPSASQACSARCSIAHSPAPPGSRSSVGSRKKGSQSQQMRPLLRALHEFPHARLSERDTCISLAPCSAVAGQGRNPPQARSASGAFTKLRSCHRLCGTDSERSCSVPTASACPSA